ncbi:MAG: SsrA-binding protein SmpB [Bacilli bacterium]|nr:SsrA-binding protein SmpB [Bacilli bacterium]
MLEKRKKINMKANSSAHIIASNRKAHFNYLLSDFLECGIELKGTEIKSLRLHGVTLQDAYVVFKKDEAFIINMHIAPYEKGNIFNHDPLRTRKLLMHKKEIIRYQIAVNTKGQVLIPTKAYFKKGRVKLEVALGKPKKLFDKRESIKKKDQQREIRKVIKNKGKAIY